MPIRHHCPPIKTPCCDMPLNGNLVERTTGIDMWTYYNAANIVESSGNMFDTPLWVQDPVDTSRQCCKRTTSSRMKGFLNGFIIPDIHTISTSDNRYIRHIRAMPTSSQIGSLTAFLIDKTLKFSYYPYTTSGSSRRYILETIDSQAGGNGYGIDIFQVGSNFQLYYNSRLGNNRTYNIVTNISANKWYDFYVVHQLVDSSNVRIMVEVFESDSLVGYADETTLGLFQYPQRTERFMCFFNSHYSYYATCRNTQAYLKDLLIYENA